MLVLTSGAVSAQRAETPGALEAIQRGQWELTDSAGVVRKLCITNSAMLVKIAHGNAQCDQVVMDSSPTKATVRYTCPGHGQGRTTLIVDTPRVLSIDTQGVIDGAPFAEKYEGRRLGACS
ncbi:DUF3617 domain-containing protein [Sphingomonas sp. CJ20]